MLEIPDIFGAVDAGSEPTYEENIRVPRLPAWVVGLVTALILLQLLLLMAWLTSSKFEEIMIFGVIIWQTVA